MPEESSDLTLSRCAGLCCDLLQFVAPKGQEKGKPASNGARISAGSTKTGRNHHRGVESDPPVAAGTIDSDNVVRKLMILKEIVAPQVGLEPTTPG